MPIELSQFKSKLSELQKSIKNELIDASKKDPNLGLQGLIRRLEASRGRLIPSFVQVEQEALEDRIQAKIINEFYSSIISDLHLLFGSAQESSFTLNSYSIFIKNKIAQMEQAIRVQEGELTELKFLRDNTSYLEAFNQKLGNNKVETSPFVVPTIYNFEEKTLNLDVAHRREVSKPEINITFLGSPDRNVLPDYEPSRILDRTALTAWYEVVGFKTSPKYICDLGSDTITTFIQAAIVHDDTVSLAAGTTLVAVDSATFNVGQWISIGEMFTYNHESVKITGVNGNVLTVTALKYKHSPFEPVYLGKDLVQMNGAVAIVDFTFSFPQQINFMRFNPFSTKPVKIHGLFIPDESTNADWVLVEGTSIDQLIKTQSVSFDRVISSKVRILIEQPYGEFIDKTVQVNQEALNVGWNVIYEDEFKKRVFALENKLANFTEKEVRTATDSDTRGFLVRQSELAKIQAQEFSKDNGTTLIDSENQFTVLNKFLDGRASADVQIDKINIKRFIYEIGIAEIDLALNVYHPFSNYKGEILTPAQEFTAYSLVSDEVTTDQSSIQHHVVFETNEEVPIVNKSDISADGEYVSKNELLDVDPITRKAKLRFDPFKSSITVVKKAQGSSSITFSVNVNSGRVVTIPGDKYEQKAVYISTYAVEDPDLHIKSNINSVKNIVTVHGTNDGRFLKLEKAPAVELGIINDEFLFIQRDTFQGIWTFKTNPSFNDSTDWVDKLNINRAFPTDGIVIDNIYYGRPCINPIKRTSIFEDFLFDMFSRYSGDSTLMVDRFFNTYQNKVLQGNIIYEPLLVLVNGEKAFNLSSYDGSPPSGFRTDIPLRLQYRHFGNRILFPEYLNASFEIQLTYRLKETTVAYGAKLLVNKKSNFWVTPQINNVLIGTLI